MNQVLLESNELSQRFQQQEGYWPDPQEVMGWFREENPGCRIRRVWKAGMVVSNYLVEFETSQAKTLFFLRW